MAVNDDPISTIQSAIEFQRQLRADPASVSDDAIRVEFGDDVDVNAIRELFQKHTFGQASKNPRVSARGKLRRRLLTLERAISEVEDAIQAVIDAPGRTNKRQDLDAMVAALQELREKTGMTRGSGAPKVEIDPDMFERLFDRS